MGLGRWLEACQVGLRLPTESWRLNDWRSEEKWTRGGLFIGESEGKLETLPKSLDAVEGDERWLCERGKWPEVTWQLFDLGDKHRMHGRAHRRVQGHCALLARRTRDHCGVSSVGEW